VENGIWQNLTRGPSGQKIQFRKKILMFSVFLLISLFIWLLNALAKNYTSSIEYPLQYTDFPEDMVFVGEMPRTVELNVNGHGFALLRYKVFRKPVPISFTVSSLTVNRIDNSTAYVLTRNLRSQVNGQLPSELRLLEINPDTLHFQFAEKTSRMVPVRPRIRFELEKQFTTVEGIRLEPDSVLVSGPDLVVDTLGFVNTVREDLGLLSRNYREKVELASVAGLEYSVSRVQCSIELERFTEVQMNIPVEVVNLPDSLSIQTFPSRIRLTCRVGLSKYERIGNNPFRAVIDYEEIGEQTRELEIRLRNIPDYLLGYEYSPRTVEFLISLR